MNGTGVNSTNINWHLLRHHKLFVQLARELLLSTTKPPKTSALKD